jgi:tRNA(Ile)-lysidine synthase TilS/MesJ
MSDITIQDIAKFKMDTKSINYINILGEIEPPPYLYEFWRDNKDVWFSHLPLLDVFTMLRDYSEKIYKEEDFEAKLIIYNKLKTKTKTRIVHREKYYTEHHHTLKKHVSYLLYFDQIYRHDNPHLSQRDRENAFKYATKIALLIIHHPEFMTSKFEPWETVFTLLALRHNQSLNLKMLSLKKLYEKISKLYNNNQTQTQTQTQTQELHNPDIHQNHQHTIYRVDSLYLRFLNASIDDINRFKLENNYFESERNIIDDQDISENTSEDAPPDTNINNNNNHNDNDKKIQLQYETFKDILENNHIILLPSAKSKEFICNIEQIKKHKLYKLFYDVFDKCLSSPSPSPLSPSSIAVSISGGVDSMVCSLMSAIYCREKNIKELILLHICYNNRECCDSEINLLKYWVYYLKRITGFQNIKLYIRRIDEIKRERNSNFRELYEESTRKIRFSFYNYFKDIPVILGHNKDDTYENIFSNLSKRIHFDNLLGMTERTIESGVIILRPLLSIMKRDILDFANSSLTNIPHLKDSTPPWSTRGRMRDNLIPFIEEFDGRIMGGLNEFIGYTTFLTKQWTMMFNLWLKASIEVEKQRETSIQTQQYINKSTHIKYQTDIEKIKINRDEFFETNYENLSFWIKLWFTLNIDTRPSNKSFKNLIMTIRDNRYIKCTMNKKYSAIVGETYIFIERNGCV